MSQTVYEVARCQEHPYEWRAEGIEEPEGLCYVVCFTGPEAEARAREYAAWKNGQQSPE